MQDVVLRHQPDPLPQFVVIVVQIPATGGLDDY
jgi:hypothetical protein